MAWLTNPCDLGAPLKDANGNAMYAAFAKYVHDYYFAGSTADAARRIRGASISITSRLQWARRSVTTSKTAAPAAPTDISVYQSLVAGLAEGVQSWRANAPGETPLRQHRFDGVPLSDDSSHRIFERPYTVIGAHATTARMDFQDFKDFIGETYCMDTWYGLARCAAYIATTAPAWSTGRNSTWLKTTHLTRTASAPGAHRVSVRVWALGSRARGFWTTAVPVICRRVTSAEDFT